MGKKKSDLLDGLLGPASEPKTEAPRGQSSKGGLTSLDLLALPPDQKKLINWLTRRKQATFREIQEALGQDEQEITSVLETLRASKYIYQALIEGEVYYRVVFKGVARRRSSGLLGELWARVDLDQATFLKQIPLFQQLSDEQIRDIANQMEERQYSRDEVIIWQGEIGDRIFFVKSGVVGIMHFSDLGTEKRILRYLKTGDILGEYSTLLRQGGAAQYTVTALSAVTMLTMEKMVFVETLEKYPLIPIELSRLLVQRLQATDARLTNAAGCKLVLVIGVAPNVGTTTLGSIQAMTLAHVTQKSTAYTEQPAAGALAGLFHIPPDTETYQHPGGYEVVASRDSAGLPSTLRATLALDRLAVQYGNVVIGVHSQSEDIVNYLAEHADQILVVTTPESEAWEELNRLNARLRTIVHPEKVAIFTVLNRTRPEHRKLKAHGRVDFDLPFVKHMPPLDQQCIEDRPTEIAAMASALADRLGRTNQVSIFIPTTIDVDQAVDTTPFVERTLAFLGQRFGGATTNQARGVWNSADSGLVGEDIHIVRSYATQADLDRFLQEILSYVEELKQELRQEAMAVEINQKLMLI